jgi:hypothetical protein
MDVGGRQLQVVRSEVMNDTRHTDNEPGVRSAEMDRIVLDMQKEYGAGATGYYLTRREMKRVLDALTDEEHV